MMLQNGQTYFNIFLNIKKNIPNDVFAFNSNYCFTFKKNFVCFIFTISTWDQQPKLNRKKTSSLHHRIQIICCLMVPWKWGKCFKNSFTPPNGPKASLLVVSPRISHKSVEKKYRCERDVPAKFPDVVKHLYTKSLELTKDEQKRSSISCRIFIFLTMV